jgi:nucleotide-binding universal stress UspA family protein
MFRNVIVGVDHREGGRDAIQLAQQMASRLGGLTLAHVYTGDPYVYRGVSADYAAAAARKRDLALMAQARAEAGVAGALRWHRASSVVDGLNELCRAGRADLLIVGASQRRGWARLLERGAVGPARDHDPWAVAIAPAGYRCEPAAIQDIGVGYDGSAASRRALHVARGLAVTYGSRLSAFHVIDARVDVIDTSAAQEMAQDARARIAGLGIADAHAAAGRPSEELTLFSRVVDLLIIGGPRHVAPGRPRHSGVARELVRSARCPLLVVRSVPLAAEPVDRDREQSAGAQRRCDQAQLARAGHGSVAIVSPELRVDVANVSSDRVGRDE